ncbi:MAG: sulfotransferase [Gammaproteobacteria bacterium]
MARPTFIGIGAQKCASTWIYDILADHPEVVLSETKEVDFFSYHYDHGLQWYESNFDSAAVSSMGAAGEISPSYFYEPAVPARIKAHYPDAKIIVSLRDPVKRAVSNHKHELRVGHLTGEDLSLEKGLENNTTYIDQGLYAKHLQRWYDVFPKEQVFVILFDEIIADKAGSAKRVFNYLGIDDKHNPAALNAKSNPSYMNKYKGLESFRGAAQQLVHKMGLDGLWQLLGKLGLKRLYAKVNKMPSEAVMPTISDKTMALLAAAFKDDIEKLEVMLDKDLSAWK